MKANIDTFIEVYESKLRKAIRETPRMYAYGPEQIPIVISKMRAAILLGSFLIEQRAIKDTCRELGIPCTYISIAKYVRGEL